VCVCVCVCVLIDADECQAGVCDRKTSTCINTVGSYKCQCNIGFRFERDRCRGQLFVVLMIYYVFLTH